MKKNLLGILIVLFFYNTAAAQQKMELVIPKGHSGGVKNLLVTSDNHYLVSGGSGLVNIYDLIQNKLLKTFNLSSNSYNASASQIVFNKSQTKLLCSSKAGLFIINLDDLSIKNIDFTKATTAIFSTDESKIYTAGKEGAYEVKIYNGESKKLFNNTEDEIANVRLAKDGKAIYFAGENKLYKFNVESQTATLYSIPNMMDVLPNGQFFTLNKIDYSNYTFALYDPQTMQQTVVKNYPTKNANLNMGYNWHWWSFDKNLNELFVASEKDAFRYDIATQELTMVSDFAGGHVGAFTTTNNCDVWLVGYNVLDVGLGIQKFEWKKNRLLSSIGENVFRPDFIIPAKHNNGFVLSGAIDEHIKYFCVSSTKQKVLFSSWNNFGKHPDDEDPLGPGATISPDGKYIITANYDKKTQINDANDVNNSTIITLSQKQHPVKILYTKDSKTFAIYGTESIVVFNTTTKQEIKTITINTSGKGYGDKASPFADILPDGSVVFGTYRDKDAMKENGEHVAAWSINSGLKLWDRLLPKAGTLVQLNDDGTKLFCGYRNVLEELDISSGNVISTAVYPSDKYTVVSALNAAATMVCVNSPYDNEHIVWNRQTKEKVFQINELVSSLTFLKNDSLLITGSADGLKLWNIFTNKELAKIIMYENSKEYIVITPKGLFDGTETAIKSMYFVKNKEIIPLDSYFETYYTPDLLAHILSNLPLNDVEDINILNNRLSVKLQYAEKKRNLVVGEDITTYENISGTAEITVTAKAPGDKVAEIRVFHNGKILSLATRGLFVTDDITGIDSKKYSINLLPGQNNFKAIALNIQRTESLPDEIIINYKNTDSPIPIVSVPVNNKIITIDPIDRTATLHLIVVGINQYQNKKMSLNYALADATSFKDELEKDVKSVIANVKTYFVTDDAMLQAKKV